MGALSLSSLPSPPPGAPGAPGGGLRAMRARRRPLLAAVLVCASLCWLMLAMTVRPPAEQAPPPGPAAGTAPYAASTTWAPGDAAELPDPATWRGLSPKQISQLSKLGRMLFLQDTANLTPKNKTFTVLIWKHGLNMENRHIKHYGNERHDPYEECSVRNCRMEYDDDYLEAADAVIFHLHRTKGYRELPARHPALSGQRWIFLTDESPHHTFLIDRRNNKLKNYAGVFNWSMSYKMGSDVPVPYGRTVTLSKEEAATALATLPRNFAQGKTGVVAVMGSNCGGVNHRWDYVHELQKHLPVDVYGHCGNKTMTCPGGFTKDCPLIKKYKFYLAFENSNCREYVTEKVWWNAYKNGAIPVIMGDSQESLRQLLPRRSYLHVDDFASPADLARFLIHLDTSDRDYNTYFQWKYKYKILNEHGYFQSRSYHYCRVCEALNYNDEIPKVYEHPEEFLNVEKDCKYTK